MTNLIPGADSIADDAAFKDLLYQYSVTFVSDAEQDEGYASSNAKRDRLIAFIDSRAAAKVGADVATDALLKLCDQLDAMKLRLRAIPGEGQRESYYVADDVQCYVEEARARLSAGAPAETPKPIVECPRYDFGCGRIESLWCDNCPERTTQPSPAPIAGGVEKDAWTTWELCQACVKTGFGPLEAQTLLNNLEAARAAMLANSSSGEAG